MQKCCIKNLQYKTEFESKKEKSSGARKREDTSVDLIENTSLKIVRMNTKIIECITSKSQRKNQD